MNNEMGYKDLSNKDKEVILKLFKTDEEGLNKNEVNKRLDEYGENIANNRKKKT